MEYFICDENYRDFIMLNQEVENWRDCAEDEDTLKDLIMVLESLDKTGFEHQNTKDIFAVTYLCLYLSIVYVMFNINDSNKDRSIIKIEELLNAVLELLGILCKWFNKVISYISLLQIIVGIEYHKKLGYIKLVS